MEAMKFLNQFLRLWFPKFYIRRGMDRLRFEHDKELKTAGKLSGQDKCELQSRHQWEFQEWDEWLASIEDAELVEKAKRMDISLDDFPYPASDKNDPRTIDNSHYHYGEFGERMLCAESRDALRKAMRERAPAYRKEQREFWALWIQVGAVITGLTGAATGLIAVFVKAKCG